MESILPGTAGDELADLTCDILRKARFMGFLRGWSLSNRKNPPHCASKPFRPRTIRRFVHASSHELVHLGRRSSWHHARRSTFLAKSNLEVKTFAPTFQ